MKCDICTRLRSSLTENVLDGVRYHTERIRRLYLRHIKDVRAERGAYWARRRYACEFPEEKLSIIIDGSDQINNGCPWYRTKTHTMEGPRFLLTTAWRLPTHLHCSPRMLQISPACVRRAGPWRRSLCLPAAGSCRTRSKRHSLPQFPLFAFTVEDFSDLGANVTIECLQQTLVRLHRMKRAAGSKLPSHLDLQLDNTTKQNKNRSVGIASSINVFVYFWVIKH